ncbi:hypothetical protein BGZ70_003244 [Mortierella alpina]|uniref:Uncharacterized protein n=1 Tax=Mortierella alpina TaxID=64518 RepID=A0A9P6M577_MORAP|nr:hypothetical protein BGZ70_003244 [Mortierella alpina]
MTSQQACSTESFRHLYQDQDPLQHSQQHSQLWTGTTTAELLKENLALVQKTALAQQEVTSVRNNQARLENQVYELDQKLAEARKENHRLSRAKKDFDRQLDSTKTAFEKERSLWSERETELIAENNAAHARAMRAHEKLVKELRDQILHMNQDLQERQRSFLLQRSELQSEIAQARELNKNLMEENESFQMLLHEKSMNGEFMQTDIMKNTGYDDDITGTPMGARSTGSINLADELGKAFERSPAPSTDRSIESLTEELKTLKESNTALGLYISKILSRIMENPHLQAILAADYSPRRQFVPESPAAVITQVSRSNGGVSGNNSGSEVDSKREVKKPEMGRARSRSLFSGGSVFSLRSKPTQPPPAPSSRSSNRSSSEDDAASGTSTGLTSFQEGHIVEDSPRTSHSSSDFAIVANDHYHAVPAEYEQLTTFDQPYTQTPAIPEGQANEEESNLESTMRSPTPSIATSEISAKSGSSSSSSSSSMTTVEGTPTTPVVAEGGVWRKAIRRMSLFGNSNPVLPAVKPESDAPSPPEEVRVEAV